MSATEAARQRLDGLRKQQVSYREKLQQQEAELRRLQSEVCQNRTVVEVTMPGEINKAYGEYLDILKKSPQSVQASQKEAAALLEEDFLPHPHHSSHFSSFSLSFGGSPGSFLGLLTLITTILLALGDTILCVLIDQLLVQFFLVLGFFFPALAYANKQRQQSRRAGTAAACVSLGGGYSWYGRGKRASTRFAPIHM